MKAMQRNSLRPTGRSTTLALLAVTALGALGAPAAASQESTLQDVTEKAKEVQEASAQTADEAKKKAMEAQKLAEQKAMEAKKMAEKEGMRAKQTAEKAAGDKRSDLRQRRIPGVGGGTKGTVGSAGPVPVSGARTPQKAEPGHEGHDHAGGAPAGIPQTRDVDARQLKNPYGGETDPNAKLEIAFGAEKHDFGAARQGRKLEHTFNMQATGTADLIIRQAKPTCGCTVTDVLVENETGEMVKYNFGDPIKPGKQVHIAAALDTKNKRNKAAVRVNVYANDPVGLHQLALEATVEPFMNVNPTFVNFGDLFESSVQTQTIDVRTTKGEPIALTIGQSLKPMPKPEGLEIELIPVNAGDDGRSNHWQIQVKAGPGLKEGQMGYSLMLETDQEMVGADAGADGLVPRYTANASIQGRVLGPISCTPEYFSLGLVSPGQVVTKSVDVTAHDPNIDLTKATVSIAGYRDRELQWADHFSAKIEPIAGQNAVRVSVTLDGLPEASNGSFQGSLVINTGSEIKSELTAVFSGVCRAAAAGQTQGAAGR